MVRLFTDGVAPSDKECKQFVLDRMDPDPQLHRFITGCKKHAREMASNEWELDTERFPAVVEALRKLGHHVKLHVSSHTEMLESLARMMTLASAQQVFSPVVCVFGYLPL